MRKNEYNSIDEFIFEYCKGREFSWENADLRERYMGIEFCAEGTYYRMCRESYDPEYSPVLENGNPGIFKVMLIHPGQGGYPVAESYELVGWYDSIESLLDDCIIQGKPFREVIMDDETEILGKD